MSILWTLTGLSMLVVLHELGHYSAAKLFGMRVLKFSVGFGPTLWKVTWAQTDWQVAAIPLGGYVHIDGMGPSQEDGSPPDKHAFCNKPMWQRMWVILAGPITNWFLAAFCIAFSATTVGLNQYDPQSTVIGEVIQDKPAHRAGLVSGDRIVRIGNTQLTGWAQLVEVIQANSSHEIEVEIENQQGKKIVRLTPEQQSGIGRIGVAPLPHTIYWGFVEASVAGLRGAWKMTTYQVNALSAMVVGEGSGQLSGLPGIVKTVSAHAKKGLRKFLETLAWLSIGLFILNLAPFPALDGGRFLFLAAESVRGKPLNATFEGIAHALGFLLLMGLMIFVSIRDLFQP